MPRSKQLPDPPVHCLDTHLKCIVCGAAPTRYLEIIFTQPNKRTTLDMREAPVCSDACADKQYVTLINQGFCANATDVHKRIVLCKKQPLESLE